MSINQHTGKEETEKLDFGKLTPDEQRKASRENISEEQDELPLNEKLAQKAREQKEKNDIRMLQ